LLDENDRLSEQLDLKKYGSLGRGTQTDIQMEDLDIMEE